MENVTGKYSQPCVIDVKIGSQTWDPNATPEKIAYDKSKFLIGEKIGFRFLGIKTFTQNGQVLSRTKEWGKQLTESDLVPAFREFLGDRERTRIAETMDSWLTMLTAIRDWFERQRLFHFYSSSLLLVFEGDACVRSPDCRMIDFSHVFRSTQRDANYLFGVDNFIAFLNDVKTSY